MTLVQLEFVGSGPFSYSTGHLLGTKSLALGYQAEEKKHQCQRGNSQPGTSAETPSSSRSPKLPLAMKLRVCLCSGESSCCLMASLRPGQFQWKDHLSNQLCHLYGVTCSSSRCSRKQLHLAWDPAAQHFCSITGWC